MRCVVGAFLLLQPLRRVFRAVTYQIRIVDSWGQLPVYMFYLGVFQRQGSAFVCVLDATQRTIPPYLERGLAVRYIGRCTFHFLYCGFDSLGPQLVRKMKSSQPTMAPRPCPAMALP